MEPIRLATPEEVEDIRPSGDLTSTSGVVTMDGSTAVMRHCWEIDPVHFNPEHSTARRAMFIWGLQNVLRLQGVQEYYFNAEPNDETWNAIVQKWGATPVFKTPNLRYKQVL